MSRKIAFFSNGVLYDVAPRNVAISLYEDRQVAYDADTVIVSDGETYDPMKPESIADLRVPQFNRENESVVFDLSYILKMRRNMLSDPYVIPAFVSKVLEMMEASPIEWRRGDYLRVICNYYANGLFEEGDRFEAEYRASHKALFSNPLDDLQEAEHLSTKYYFEEKWYRYQEYAEMKKRFPDLVPPTATGYMRIRTQQSKRFLAIKEAAEKQGYSFNFEKSYHFCRRFRAFFAYSQEYDHSGRYGILKSIQCSKCVTGDCDGRDEYGLKCGYP